MSTPTVDDLKSHFNGFYTVTVHGPEHDRALLIEQYRHGHDNWQDTDEHCQGQVSGYIEDNWGAAALDEFVITTAAALGVPEGDRRPAVVVQVASSDDKQRAALDLARWYQRVILACHEER